MRTLGQRLRSGRWDAFEDALRDAVAAGATGDAELVTAFDDVAAARKVLVVAALGDAVGTAGPALLRGVVGGGVRGDDLVCAALLALAKRCGADASGDLAAALADRRTAVKEYAVLGLAGVGDGRAWEDVFAHLRHLLGRTRKTQPADALSSPVAAAVCYLARHLDNDRCARLVELVRQRWERLNADEDAWLRGLWPAVAPGGPAAALVVPPVPGLWRDWIRRAIFDPVF